MKLNKLFFIFILFLLFSSFAFSVEECGGVIDKTEVPCFILLPYDSDCTTQNITIYNNASTNLGTFTLGQYNPIKCNHTFNYTSLGTYTYKFSTDDTGSIILKEVDDEMASFSVTLFILLINSAFFIIPFFIRMKNVFAQSVIRKAFFIMGIALLALNTAIVATIAEAAGLDVTHELFNIYLWIFTKSIYFSLLIVIYISIVSSIKQWKMIHKTQEVQRDKNYDD